MSESGYELVVAIVNRGKGVEAIAAASEAGAKGATLVSGRGSGFKDAPQIYGLKMEPEKDIVLIACSKEHSGAILKRIDQVAELAVPGNGLGMILPISVGVGLNKLVE